MQVRQFCVVLGNPFDGITLYGPFDDAEKASEWAEFNNEGATWWIVDLSTPEE